MTMTREICNNVSKPIKVTPSDGTPTLTLVRLMDLITTSIICLGDQGKGYDYVYG